MIDLPLKLFIVSRHFFFFFFLSFLFFFFFLLFVFVFRVIDQTIIV